MRNSSLDELKFVRPLIIHLGTAGVHWLDFRQKTNDNSHENSAEKSLSYSNKYGKSHCLIPTFSNSYFQQKSCMTYSNKWMDDNC